MRYFSLQVLRIYYMLVVLINHVRAYTYLYGGVDHTFLNAIPDAFCSSALPFFSISGFIMAFLIDIGYRNFLPRRVVRIYVPFLIAVAIALTAYYFLFGEVPNKDIWRSISLLPLGPLHWPLHVEWTLVYEVSFYLLVTPFTFRPFRRYYLPFLIVWTIVIFIAYFGFYMRSIYVAVTFRTVYFSNYTLYYTTGGIAYYLVQKTKTHHWAWYVLGIIASCVPVIISCWNRPPMFPRYMSDIALWSTCTAVCLYCAVKLEPYCHWKWLIAFSKLGEYTYGFYLIHTVILVCLYGGLVYRLGIPLGTGTTILGLVLATGLGLAFGRFDMAVHAYFRNKLRR